MHLLQKFVPCFFPCLLNVADVGERIGTDIALYLHRACTAAFVYWPFPLHSFSPFIGCGFTDVGFCLQAFCKCSTKFNSLV